MPYAPSGSNRNKDTREEEEEEDIHIIPTDISDSVISVIIM
jgi:hypothetical protein